MVIFNLALSSILHNILPYIALLGMLSITSITHVILHVLILAMIPINVTNSKVLSKDILNKFKEYMRGEHFHTSVAILDWDESNNIITYSLCGYKFIAKLGVDGFYRI